MKRESWLLRTASAFAQIERSMKAVPMQAAALYPPPQTGGANWLTFPGWDVLERQAQDDGRKDLVRAKTAVTSPWVYANVQAIANEFSTADLIVKERRGAKLEDVENHELEQIWESPNEHMGRSFVTTFWAWSYVLVGKAYLYWVPDETGTTLKEVWPIPPWMIRPVPDAVGFISGYAFKASADAVPVMIPTEMITYSHSVNLFDIRDGLSFLAAAYQEIQADLAASAWNLNFFDTNNGVPDGAIMLAPDTLDQDIERVRMELRDFFGGTKRGIAVGRSGDLKWQEFGRSQKDMEFGAGREFASKVIGRTLGFPDGYWSDLANRANAEQARRTMISGAVWPLLVRLAEDMNAQRRGVVQRWYGEDTRVEFKDIRPEDKEAQAKELKMYEPFVPINVMLGMIGQEPLDKNDPRGTMLVAEIAKGAPIPGTPAALLIEDLQTKKDEKQAQQIADQVAAGTIPDPNAPPAPPPDAGGGAVPPPEADAAPPPEEGAPPVPPEAAAGKAVDDLALWERKALKSFKARGRAGVGFASAVIDPDDHARISVALMRADSVAAVKAAFKKPRRVTIDTLADDDAVIAQAQKLKQATRTPATKATEVAPIVIINQPPAVSESIPLDDSGIKAALADVRDVLAALANRADSAPTARTVVKEVTRDEEDGLS